VNKDDDAADDDNVQNVVKLKLTDSGWTERQHAAVTAGHD